MMKNFGKIINNESEKGTQVSGIALDYGLDYRGFEPRHGLGIFLFTTASKPALGPTHPPIQRVTGAVSLRVKRPGRESVHSSPSSAEVKNAWSHTSTPQYTFIAWRLLSTGKTLL
jgi:hypothetical protein